MTDTIAERPAATRRAAGPAARSGMLLPILLTAQFMAILDVSIVNVAAPTIRADLHVSGAGLQLVIAGYTISYAMLLITGARLGDRLGYRRVFLSGLVGFTAASLACGLASGSALLIGFRFVQGGAAAMMIPQVLSLIQRNFTGAVRARALGRYAAVIAAGAVIGQVAGGALVAANLFGTGWRPVFLVNVPIGLVLLIGGVRVLPADTGERNRGLDLPGLITLSAAVLLFVVPLVLGHEEHWPAWGWVCLGLSVVLVAVFTAIERKASSPLVPGRILGTPGILPALGAIAASMAAYAGYLFSLALHLQTGLGFSPLHAGASFVLGGACFGVASLNWRRLPSAWHRSMIPVGFLVGALGMVLIGLGLGGGNGPGTVFWLSQVCFGFGFGVAFSPLLTQALTNVPSRDAADASGLLTTMTQLAQVVGVATFGSLYLTVASHAPSAHSLALTAAGLTTATVLAAGFAALLPRSRAARVVTLRTVVEQRHADVP